MPALRTQASAPGERLGTGRPDGGRPDVAGVPEWLATLGLPVVAGLGGASLIEAAGVVLGPHGPTDSRLERAIVGLAPGGDVGTVLACCAMGVGLALLLGAWLAIGVRLRRGDAPGPLVRTACTWSLPFVLGPPLFSRDAYSYAAQGVMAAEHLHPYDLGPAVLGDSRFLPPVSSAWLHTRSPYGPLFLKLSESTVDVAHHDVITAVLLLRVLAIVGVVLIGLFLPRLASSLGADPARAVWLGLCNPLVLLHFVAGEHNDALMVGLLVAGLALAVANRPLLGVLCCTVGAAVKAPAALGVVFIVLDAARRPEARERRVATVGKLGGASIAAFVAITLATGMGWGWIGALGVPGTNKSLLTPTTLLAHAGSLLVGQPAVLLHAVRALALLATAAGMVWLIWHQERLGVVRACGLALLLVVALGPVVLPWYALWGVVVLAAVATAELRALLVLVSFVLALVVQPSGSAMPDMFLVAAVLVVVAAVVVAVVPSLRERWLPDAAAIAAPDLEWRRRRELLVDAARRRRVG